MKNRVRISISTRLSLWLAIAVAPVVFMCHYALNSLDAPAGVVTKHDASFLIIGCTIVSLISMLTTWSFFLFPLCRRIRRLAGVADCITNDKACTPLEDHGNDELGRLSLALDQLSKSSTETSKKHEIDRQSLNHQATHDELTGLSNRKYGNETISRLGKNTNECPISILFLDLDGFKAVNDTCGHAIGDEILIAVSLRLKAILRNDTVLIRWGGDEFVIVLPNADQRRAISVAQDVAALFRQPISTTQGVHKLGCSIGLATSRPDTSLDEILQEADAKMYENKKKRKSIRTVPAELPELPQATDASNDDLLNSEINKAA